MRKGVTCTLGIVAACLTLAPVAAAEKPVREFIPAADFVIEGSCSFDVGVHIVANKEYAITFSNGTTLVTGALKATLTNLSDPSKSVTLNVPGPGLYTFDSDGSLTLDARGPWLFFFPDTLLYSTGHSVLTVSATGDLSLTQQGGTTTDLCTVLD